MQDSVAENISSGLCYGHVPSYAVSPHGVGTSLGLSAIFVLLKSPTGGTIP